jgi:hypothetical protein
MPFEDPNNVSENPYVDVPHFKGIGANALAGENEDPIYETDWENPELVTQAQGANPPITTINQSGGYATIRLNQTLYYTGSVWFQGQVSGSIPAGATMRGRDSNNNGIPDLFESFLRDGKIHFDA